MELIDTITTKLDQMNKYLAELQSLLPQEEKEYTDDTKTKRACEKTIELAIETVISIMSAIISYNKFGVPQSEDDLVDILEKQRVLSHDLSPKIREMKGFRNILVHKYGVVDDSRSFHFLTHEISDFSLFENEIKTYLRTL